MWEVVVYLCLGGLLTEWCRTKTNFDWVVYLLLTVFWPIFFTIAIINVIFRKTK